MSQFELTIPERGTILRGTSDSFIAGKKIGHGGVGTAVKCLSRKTGRHVVSKFLHGGRFPITDQTIERFRREIDMSIGLSHPNLVSYIDRGKFCGCDFLVLDHINGGTLADRISASDYTVVEMFKWCADIIQGVLYLHSNGFIHRDIKPNNILLDELGTAKVADLGLIKDISSMECLTLSDDRLGSLLYISAHQRENPNEANEADDAYSVCCCIYELMSGRRIHPFCQALESIARYPLHSEISELIMRQLNNCEEKNVLQWLLEYFIQGPNGNPPANLIEEREELNVKSEAFETARALVVKFKNRPSFYDLYDFLDSKELGRELRAQAFSKRQWELGGIARKAWGEGVEAGLKTISFESKTNGDKQLPKRSVLFRVVSELTFGESDVKIMIGKHGLFDKSWNPYGRGISHLYEEKLIENVPLIFDYATGLAWQRSGSEKPISRDHIEHYINQLNYTHFGGYNDWRLPTLEEAMSLVMPFGNDSDFQTNIDRLSVHIDDIFDRAQSPIWTCDMWAHTKAWCVNFVNANCFLDYGADPDLPDSIYVRAVKSL